MTISNEYELKSWNNDRLLMGIDESGAGCYAGSLFCAGVIFPRDYDFDNLPGLNDSKQMKEERRNSLEAIILKDTLWSFVGSGSAAEVEQFSAYHLRFTIAARKIAECAIGLNRVDIIFDGDVPLKCPAAYSSACLIKGDTISLSIAAASVLAKAAKDREMRALDIDFPEYDWANNKGYHSNKHDAAILKHGITVHHRKNYCAKLLGLK